MSTNLIERLRAKAYSVNAIMYPQESALLFEAVDRLAALEAEASEGERRGLERALVAIGYCGAASGPDEPWHDQHDMGVSKCYDAVRALIPRQRELGSAAANQLSGSRVGEPEAPAREGWQPIETAPKDGSRLLVWFVHENARWSTDPVGEGWATAHDARWTDHNGGGWVWHGLCGSPTHWRPLPPPPSQDREPNMRGAE